MLFRMLSLGVAGLVSLTVLGMMPVAPQEPESPPPRKKGLPVPKKHGGAAEKKEGEGGPEGDLQRAYNLLRRLRADASATGRADDRIRDWTERAAKYYGDGIRAYREENPQLAHEYAVIAHDLARAIDHARNAACYDRPDEKLPLPPGKGGSGREAYAHRDLTKAYERLREGDDGSDAGPEAKYYRDAASTLYREARRDFEAGRTERAGELARAAEAMTHVCEHLGRAADVRIEPPPNVEGKVRRDSGRSGAEGGRGGILPPPTRP